MFTVKGIVKEAKKSDDLLLTHFSLHKIQDNLNRCRGMKLLLKFLCYSINKLFSVQVEFSWNPAQV